MKYILLILLVIKIFLFMLKDQKILNEYMSNNEIKKLHLGCWRNILDGWLNTDLQPYTQEVFQLDVTKKFPFEDDTFDYILSEHMIEHIPYNNGLYMIKECLRVLKKNGKIRVSTPNFQFLLDLYSNERTQLQNDYIKWTTDEFIWKTPYYSPIFVINNFVRDWWHQFIYDEKTLYNLLKIIWFQNIQKFQLNESNIEIFKNLENEFRMPKWFLKLETMTFEATKI